MARKPRPWLDTRRGHALLGVSRATLYAYVSRGCVRSEPVPGRPRERRYAREDVERLRVRAEERRNPEKAAEHALRWGVPILESAITLIADGKLYYRGHDAAELARTRSLEEVAALMLDRRVRTPTCSTRRRTSSAAPRRSSLPITSSRAQSALPLVAARDPLAFDLRPRAVAQTGWRIVNLLTSVAAGVARARADAVEETLGRVRWSVAAPS